MLSKYRMTGCRQCYEMVRACSPRCVDSPLPQARMARNCRREEMQQHAEISGHEVFPTHAETRSVRGEGNRELLCRSRKFSASCSQTKSSRVYKD